MASSLLVLENKVFSALQGIRKEGQPLSRLLAESSISKKNLVATFSVKDSAGAGYFLYKGKVYDGIELADIPIAEIDLVSYIPATTNGSVSPGSLPKEQQVTFQEVTYVTPAKAGESVLFNQFSTATQKTELARQDPYVPSANVSSNPGVSESIQIRTSNSAGKSDYASATFTTRANWSPELTASSASFVHNLAKKPQSIAGFLQVSDIDRDPVSVTLTDTNRSSGSGFFAFGGKTYQGKSLIIPASQLLDVRFFPGPAKSLDKITIDASDGITKTAKQTFTLQTLADRKPILSIAPQTFRKSGIGTGQAIESLVTVSDPDSDAPQAYFFKDLTPSKDSGYFTLKGKPVPSGQQIEVKASSIAELQYVPGVPGSLDKISAAVKSGLETSAFQVGLWGTEKNTAPNASAKSQTFAPNTAGTLLGVAGFVQSSDFDGDPITRYQFTDANSDANSGYLQYNGKSFQGKALEVLSTDLGLVYYVPGQAGISDRISVAVSDGFNWSPPAAAEWKTGTPVKGFTKSVSLGIDKTLSLGDFLGVPNEKKWTFFLGPDASFANTDQSYGFRAPGFTSANYAYFDIKTGNNKFKAGLDLKAGYGLGSLNLKGGATATIEYNSDSGLKLAGATVDPQLALQLPYAYLGIDAVADIAFNPSVKSRYDILRWKGESGNLLAPLNFSINKRVPLVGLDTRNQTGSSLSKTFSVGGFSSSAKLPQFSLPSPSAVPAQFALDPKWKSAIGPEYAYSYNGSTNLLDFSLSLAQIASYFGLPLSFSQKFFDDAIKLEGSLVDASISAKSDLLYSGSVSFRPNVTLAVEGSSAKYEVKTGLVIPPSSIKDLNNDGKLSLAIQADPVIGAAASANVKSSLNGKVDALKGKASINLGGYNKSWEFGPLASSGTIPLGGLGDIPLFNISKTYRLSEIAPSIQSQLALNFDVPYFNA